MSSDQYPDYFMAQSCLHIVINYLRPPETDQNMLLFVLSSLASAKFQENIEIPRKRANSAARLEIPWSAENCGPYSWGAEDLKCTGNLSGFNSSQPPSTGTVIGWLLECNVQVFGCLMSWGRLMVYVQYSLIVTWTLTRVCVELTCIYELTLLSMLYLICVFSCFNDF